MRPIFRAKFGSSVVIIRLVGKPAVACRSAFPTRCYINSIFLRYEDGHNTVTGSFYPEENSRPRVTCLFRGSPRFDRALNVSSNVAHPFLSLSLSPNSIGAHPGSAPSIQDVS